MIDLDIYANKYCWDVVANGKVFYRGHICDRQLTSLIQLSENHTRNPPRRMSSTTNRARSPPRKSKTLTRKVSKNAKQKAKYTSDIGSDHDNSQSHDSDKSDRSDTSDTSDSDDEISLEPIKK